MRRKAGAPAETHASTPDEVVAILDVLKRAKELKEGLKLQAQTAIALMFFAGLRPGEARGGRWADYNGETPNVKQNVWPQHTTDPNKASAPHPHPVTEPLTAFPWKLHFTPGNPPTTPTTP